MPSKKKHKPQPKKQDFCEICGNLNGEGRRIYCTLECAKVARREQSRQYEKAKRKNPVVAEKLRKRSREYYQKMTPEQRQKIIERVRRRRLKKIAIEIAIHGQEGVMHLTDEQLFAFRVRGVYDPYEYLRSIHSRTDHKVVEIFKDNPGGTVKIVRLPKDTEWVLKANIHGREYVEEVPRTWW